MLLYTSDLIGYWFIYAPNRTMTFLLQTIALTNQDYALLYIFLSQ